MVKFAREISALLGAAIVHVGLIAAFQRSGEERQPVRPAAKEVSFEVTRVSGAAPAVAKASVPAKAPVPAEAPAPARAPAPAPGLAPVPSPPSPSPIQDPGSDSAPTPDPSPGSALNLGPDPGLSPGPSSGSPPAATLAPAPDAPAIHAAIQAAIQYPRLARRDALEGRVILRFRIDASGHAHDISIVKALHPFLDEAAREAVRRAAPFRSPPGTVRVPVDFSLRDPR